VSSKVARQKLIELVGRFGSELCDDPRRCEALLRDVCSEEKREIFVLVSAVRERVGADLLNCAANIPAEVLFARLTKRLHENLGLGEDLARWGVETWALALGITTGGKSRLTLECPKCSARVSIARRLVGQKIRCPNCQASLRVPDQYQASEIEGVNGGADMPASSALSDDAVCAKAPIPTVSAAGSTEEDDVFSEFPRVSPEQLLRQAVRRVLEDGVVTDQERAEVNKLRRELGLDSALASRIVSEVKAEQQIIRPKAPSDQSSVTDPLALEDLPLLPALRDEANASSAVPETPSHDDYLPGTTPTSPDHSRAFQTAASHDDKPIAEYDAMPAEQALRDAVRLAFSTGFVTYAQRAGINKLCRELAVPANAARRILAEVKKELGFDGELSSECPRCGATGKEAGYFRGRPVQCPDCHESWDAPFAPVEPDGTGSRAGTSPVITPPVVPQPSKFLGKAVGVQVAVVSWAMMISGVWGGLFSGAFFFASLFGFFDSNLGPGGGSLVLHLLNLAICRAGFHLKERRRFRSVLVGLVAGLIPINVFCFFLTTPLAIWGLVLFCRRDVKREFDAHRLVWKKGSEEGGSSAAPLPGVTDDDFLEVSLSE
jgi:hypothetical protein